MGEPKVTPCLPNVGKKEITEKHIEHKTKTDLKKSKIINYWLRWEVSKTLVYDYRIHY